MSVDWNCGKCRAYHEAKAIADEKGDDCKEWMDFYVLRDSLIWALLVIGFPSKSDWRITEDNWREIFVRLHILERVNGPYRKSSREKFYFTPAEVESMIGLSVNSGNKSDAEFWEAIKRLARDEPEAALRNYDRAQAKAANE